MAEDLSASKLKQQQLEEQLDQVLESNDNRVKQSEAVRQQLDAYKKSLTSFTSQSR